MSVLSNWCMYMSTRMQQVCYIKLYYNQLYTQHISMNYFKHRVQQLNVKACFQVYTDRIKN